MAEHGTRTMYVHYGCRCEECCKAEHRQYLKRREAQKRKRTYSKWGTDDIPLPVGKQSQRIHNANRYRAMKDRASTYTHRIVWNELADAFEMKCAICGCDVDPTDVWVGDDGRMRFGRNYPTVDHIVPLKHGGTDTIENVQLVCKHCNSVKGAKIDVIAN